MDEGVSVELRDRLVIDISGSPAVYGSDEDIKDRQPDSAAGLAYIKKQDSSSAAPHL
jgi:hypothetical protein